MSPIIRLATASDLQAINDIYNHYVLHSTCTYQEEPETLDARRTWFASHDDKHPVTVAMIDDRVVGWGSLSRFHPRSAYRYSVENSIYIHHDMHRRGIGSALLQDLIDRAGRSAITRSSPASMPSRRRAWRFTNDSGLSPCAFQAGRIQVRAMAGRHLPAADARNRGCLISTLASGSTCRFRWVRLSFCVGGALRCARVRHGSSRSAHVGSFPRLGLRRWLSDRLPQRRFCSFRWVRFSIARYSSDRWNSPDRRRGGKEFTCHRWVTDSHR